MALNDSSAREILDVAHAFWSKGDVEGLLNQYVDDLTYWCSTGVDGSPLTLVSKEQLRQFLLSVVAVAESVSVTEYFRLVDGVGRAQVECYIRHRRTGLTLAGSYRQVVFYRDDKIERMNEYHDAAKMAAFWRLIAGQTVVEESLT